MLLRWQEIIVFEKGLHRVSAEEQLVLLELALVRLFGERGPKIVAGGVGFVRSLDLLLEQLTPVDVFEPSVLLDFKSTRGAESSYGLPLQASVDKVCRFKRPAFRQLIALDSGLAVENRLEDLPFCEAQVGSSAHHKLIAEDPEREKVDGNPMVLVLHYLGRHVAR